MNQQAVSVLIRDFALQESEIEPRTKTARGDCESLWFVRASRIAIVCVGGIAFGVWGLRQRGLDSWSLLGEVSGGWLLVSATVLFLVVCWARMALQRLRREIRQQKSITEAMVRKLGEYAARVAERPCDDSERQALEEQLRQAQKMEAVGRLAGGVAHDFNNLLTVIFGYCDLLRSEVKEAGHQEMVGQIRSAGERASSLIRQLLAFSRKQILNPRVLNLSELVNNLDKLLSRLISEDIDFSTRLALDPLPVKVDPGQIEQVLMNLVVNARDAMPKGGKLTIETYPLDLLSPFLTQGVQVPPGRYALLMVSDTGCGMDSEVLAHLFEPFFTTKESGKGTGLGLSMVYGIIQQSGGYIEVLSELGNGSTFKLYLPIAHEKLSAHDSSARHATVGGRETILLVEDEEAVRMLTRKTLEGKGYTVLEARNGMEALACCDQYKGKLDMVLTDVVMPYLGGVELVQRLRESHPHLKALFMSGHTDSTALRQGVSLREFYMLSKPFTSEDLIVTVRRVLDKKRKEEVPVGVENGRL